jgi:hypothetical protein
VNSRRGWGPAAGERMKDPEPMPLVTRTRLGPYEIVSALGAGGMARSTGLGP